MEKHAPQTVVAAIRMFAAINMVKMENASASFGLATLMDIALLLGISSFNSSVRSWRPPAEKPTERRTKRRERRHASGTGEASFCCGVLTSVITHSVFVCCAVCFSYCVLTRT